jgi:hypothetical protein
MKRTALTRPPQRLFVLQASMRAVWAAFLVVGCNGCVERTTWLSEAAQDGGTSAENMPEAVAAPDAGSRAIETVDAGPSASGTDSVLVGDAVTLGDGAAGDGEPVPQLKFLARTVIPPASFHCGLPQGIPGIAADEPLFELAMDLGTPYDLGRTPYGLRKVTPVSVGTARGDLVEGTLRRGSLDLSLQLDNGVIEVEQFLSITSREGASLFMHTCGLSASAESDARVVVDLEADLDGPFGFVNTHTYVGIRTVDAEHGVLRLAVFGALPVRNDETALRISAPEDAQPQPLECPVPHGTAGAEVFSLDLTLGTGGGFLGVGKRGLRSVAPIAGGTVQGELTADVLRGGADYQVADTTSGLHADARFLLRTPAGEHVLVRKCGTPGAMAPWFEAPIGGTAAWLNRSNFRSEDAVLGFGTAHISVREAP